MKTFAQTYYPALPKNQQQTNDEWFKMMIKRTKVLGVPNLGIAFEEIAPGVAKGSDGKIVKVV